MTLATDQLDQLAVDTIRTLSIDGVQQANSGHPGAPMGMAPMAYTLWTRVPPPRTRRTRTWPDRDRFVLSRRPRLDAAVLDAPPHRLRRHARRREGVPPVGLDHAGPPGVRAHAGRRGDDRAARPGPRERRRHGDRRAPPRRGVQPAGPQARRPPHVRDLLRRRPQEGIASEASSLAGHLRLGKLIALYDDNQIQLDGPTALGVHRGRPRALRGVRLARSGVARRQRPRRDLETRSTAARDGRPPVAHRRAHDIGYGSPEQAGHAEGARRPAGPGRGPPHEGGVRLGSRTSTFYVPDEARRAVPPRRARRRGARRRVGGRARALRRARTRPRPPSCAAASRAACPTRWDAALPSYATGSEVATRNASQEAIQALAATCPSCSAAPPTCPSPT